MGSKRKRSAFKRRATAAPDRVEIDRIALAAAREFPAFDFAAFKPLFYIPVYAPRARTGGRKQ